MKFNNNDNILYIIINLGGISSSTIGMNTHPPSVSSYVPQNTTPIPYIYTRYNRQFNI